MKNGGKRQHTFYVYICYYCCIATYAQGKEQHKTERIIIPYKCLTFCKRIPIKEMEKEDKNTHTMSAYIAIAASQLISFYSVMKKGIFPWIAVH